MEYLAQFYALAAPIMLAVGMAWAPFAVVIGLIVTRQRRQAKLPDEPSTERFIYVTALHSALMVFPWIYLFAYWIGRPIPSRLAQYGYAAMYIRWFFSLAWIGLYIGVVGLLDTSQASWDSRLDIGLIVSMITLLGLNWYMLFRSFKGMLRRKSIIHTKPMRSFPSNDMYYLVPIFLWLVMEVGTIFVGGYIVLFLWGLAYTW